MTWRVRHKDHGLPLVFRTRKCLTDAERPHFRKFLYKTKHLYKSNGGKPNTNKQVRRNYSTPHETSVRRIKRFNSVQLNKDLVGLQDLFLYGSRSLQSVEDLFSCTSLVHLRRRVEKKRSRKLKS